MIKRCFSKAEPRYKDYGGRGIAVCDKWCKFDGFLEDMGEKPDSLTLERKDTNGNYCKDNCIWADWKTQARNKRNNRIVTAFGMTAPLATHCENHHKNYQTVLMRLWRGWDTERALSAPVHKFTWRNRADA